MDETLKYKYIFYKFKELQIFIIKNLRESLHSQFHILYTIRHTAVKSVDVETIRQRILFYLFFFFLLHVLPLLFSTPSRMLSHRGF